MPTQQAPREEFAAGWKTFLRELRAEAAAEAAIQTAARILLRQLDLRDITVDAATRKRVLACRDIRKQGRWLGRVLTVRRAADLFA